MFDLIHEFIALDGERMYACRFRYGRSWMYYGEKTDIGYVLATSFAA